MKCLNIADKKIKALANEFGEIITSDAIDKWEALGHTELPTIAQMKHLEQLVVDVDSGKPIHESHQTLRQSLRNEPSMTSEEKMQAEIGLDKHLRDYAKNIEAIEGNKALTKEAQDDELSKLTENFMRGNETANVGISGEKKQDLFKSLLRDTYSRIPGFENDFETEKMLVDLAGKKDFASGKPFEADFKGNIERLYEEGIKENNVQKIELSKRLKTLKENELVSLFSFFHSSQNIPYLKLLWKKARGGLRQLSIEFSNLGFEQELAKRINDHMASISDEEYVKLYDKQRKIVTTSFKNDSEYLEKLTGIPVEQWKTYVNSFASAKQYGIEKTLRNFVVFSSGKDANKVDIRLDTKQKFIDNLTKAKRKGAGSAINTIALKTPFKERAKYILPRFKNSVWNLKSSSELDSHLVNRFDNLTEIAKEKYYKDNAWVQEFKDKEPIQANIDGLWNQENEKSQEVGKLSDDDLRKTLVENYEDTQLGDNTYLQATGQFGDKDKLHMVQAKRFTDYTNLKQKYGALLMKQGATKEEAKKVIAAIEKDSKQFEDNFGAGNFEKAQLFALNYAYNFNMINDFINGDVKQYGKKGKDGKWKTAPIVDLFKRNGSTASPGMYGNKYIEGGLKEGFKQVFINDPKVGDYTPLDGQSFITRDLSDRINKSFGGIFDFNTSIKAITSFVKEGNRFLDKTNSIVIDDLAAAYPNSFYAQLFNFMQENKIDKVSTKGGIKVPGEASQINFFKDGTTEVNPDFKYDSAAHDVFVNTEDFLVQQDLTNDGKPYETTTPIQRTKNMIHDVVANKIAKMFNEIGQKRMQEMSEKILTTDKETWVKYILGKVGLSEDEILNITKEESLESDFVDLDHIETLLAKGVSLNHPDINKWLSRYVANVISKQALGRITNKTLAVEVGYVESKGFALSDYHEKDGNVYMPESAVPFNSKLRGPRTFPSKKDAIQWITVNKGKARDMFTGFDENNNPTGIHEHEIEVLPDGRAVVPGELHLITRIPADNMHSHTLARVKYILPEPMGNVVITNNKTTEIAGADFDGDQRTIESLFKDKSGNSNISGTGKHALANKALHMQMQWFYDKQNMEIALEPIDTTHFDKYLGATEKTGTKDSPETFIDSRKKNNVGLAVVGMMANLQSVYDFLRKHNSFIKLNIQKDKFDRVIGEKDFLKMPVIASGKVSKHVWMNKFIDSNHIKNSIGNLLNLSLDNVKDPKIERLGLNEVTVKMFVPALMTGMDEESVISFFRTPTAKKFVDEVRKTGSVDNTSDLKDVFRKLTNEVTKGKEEKLSIYNDQEITDSDLTSSLSETILRKLLILSSMSFEYDKLNSVIRLTEQAPKSWVDYQIALRNYTAVKNNQLRFIDTTGWNGSEFIQPAENALRVSRDYFVRFGNENTVASGKMLDRFEEALQNDSPFYTQLNRNQLAAYSKALNSAMLMISRVRGVLFKKWGKEFVSQVTKLKEEEKYPAITKALQIEGDKIQIREDLKRNPIDPTEEKQIQIELNRMLNSDIAEEKQFVKDLIDYNVFQYEMSPSTSKGSYAALFSDEIHKLIGDDLQEVYEGLKNDEFDDESLDKLFRSIEEKNPILLEKNGKDNGKGFERIYEPFADTKIQVTINDKTVFDALSKGEKSEIKINPTGINADIVMNGKAGTIVELHNGSDIATVEILSITEFDKKNPPGNVLVKFKKQAQQQKQSSDNSAYNSDVIKQLKKAIPKAVVKEDDTVNIAGELDPDGKTIRINPSYAKLDTPIHEFGHILIDAMGGTKNTTIAKGIEQLKDSDLWKETKKKYPELSEDMFEKEVLAEAIGREGAGIFTDQKKQSAFKNWLDLLFFKLRSLLGLERNVAKQLASQLLAGRKLDIQITPTGETQKQKPKSKVKVDVEAVAKKYQDVKNFFKINEKLHTYEFIPDPSVQGDLFQSTTTVIDNIKEYAYTGKQDDLYQINSELGRKVHKVLEDIISGKPKEKISKNNDFTSEEVFDKIYDHLEKVVERIKKDGHVISEVVIGSVKNQVAGTVDIMVIRNDGSVDILDLKTSIKSTEDKELYRYRYDGVKASKEDKHGLQMATYGKMIEMGDDELDMEPRKINTMTIIPINISVEGNKIKDARPEELISFGYTAYEDDTLYTLPEQPVYQEKKILDEEEDRYYKTKLSEKAYGESRFPGYKYQERQTLLDKLKNERQDIQQDTTISLEERKNKLQEVEKSIQEITNFGQKVKEAYKKYEESFDKIVEIYKTKADQFDKMDMDELLFEYNSLIKPQDYDIIAAKHLIDTIKVSIGKKMMEKGIEKVLEKHPNLDLSKISKEDMTKTDVYMKALSDISEAHPELQEFAREYFSTYQKMVDKQQDIAKAMEHAGQKVVEEYNKKKGVINKAKHFFNPMSSNEEYFSFVEGTDGKMVQPGTPAYKNLSQAQKEFIDLISKQHKNFEREIKAGGKDFDRRELAKVERSFSENLMSNGLFSAFAKYAGSNNYKQRGAKLLYNGEIKTFGEIEKEVLADNKLSKLAKLVEINKLKRRADAVVKKRVHESKPLQPGEAYDVAQGSEFEINAYGQIKSKFHNRKSKEMNYSKDFYRAYMELFSEMNFIRHMNNLVPLVESIEAYNNSLEMQNKDSRTNTLAFIDIWKRGNILKEEMEGKFGSKVDKWSSFFRKLTHLRVMAFNIPAAAFNIIVGKYNQFRGDSLRNMGKGEYRFWSQMKKSQAILKQYKATSIELDTNPTKNISNIFQFLAYGGTELGERWIQGGGVIGQMTDEEFSWLDDDGKVIDTGDDKQREEREKILLEKMESYKKKVRDIQGKYSNEDKRNFSHFELGRAIMQFKVWMPDALKDRFGNKYIDIHGEQRQGTINRAIKDGFQDLKELVRDPRLLTSNEPEWVLHRRTLRSALAFGAVMALAMGGSDDDDDKAALARLNKVMNDMAFGFSFENAKFTIKNPAAILGTVSNSVDVLESVFELQTLKHDNTWGDKGDLAAPGKIASLMPYQQATKLIAQSIDGE